MASGCGDHPKPRLASHGVVIAANLTDPAPQGAGFFHCAALAASVCAAHAARMASVSRRRPRQAS